MAAREPDASEYKRLLLSRRLSAFANRPTLALAPALASIIVIMAMMGDDASSSALIIWAITTFLLMLLRIATSMRSRTASTAIPTLERRWRAMNAILIVGSLAWAAGLPLAAWHLADRYASTLAIIGTALFGGVMLMHRTAPVAAIVHVISIGSGLAVGEWLQNGAQSWPALTLIAIYALGLIGAVQLQEQAFRAAARSELRRTESERTVDMLLNAHEAQAADWLWSIGPHGEMREGSARLASVLDTDAETLSGQSFISLLYPGPERDRIAAHIAERRTFRDEPVPVAIGGDRRMWRLSGHPQSDGRMSGVGRDVTDQLQIEDRIRTMAYVDPLTGLANRHRFNQRMHEALGPGSEDRKPAALLYLDLDDFKAVNDTQGHMFGDSLLREMGARLRREVRESDLIARVGGDEFAVLIEAPGGDGMLIECAHRLLAAAREPFSIEGQSVEISTSVGIARAVSGGDATELMRRGDLALYAAKAKGRDQLAMFDEALDRQARERRGLELDLREAVSREELILHYQPIIALQSGETIGYEALLRWQHPRRGLLMPGDFIAVAEETGLIVPLGDWVIRRALADVADWPGDFRIAINLSPSQTRSSQLLATVQAALAVSGVAAKRLEFEITEHVLLNQASAGGAMLDRLRALGAQIALDDFGTGYSSLSYLRRYRFDRVKIDRSFVQDIETSDEAQAIVSAITRLAQALGMRTTAEGVERPGQLDLLRKLGCDEAQGFLIFKPTEAGQIEAARALGEDFPGIGNEIADYREARRSAS